MADKYFVWIQPDKEQILFTSVVDPPTMDPDLFLIFRQLIAKLGGNKSFDTWQEGQRYAEDLRSRTGYQLEWVFPEADEVSEYDIDPFNYI